MLHLPKVKIVLVISIACFLLIATIISSILINSSKEENKELSLIHLKGSCPNCNVVVIDIDILRSDAINCEKFPQNTPNICDFFKNAVYFNNNVSTSDLTRPAYTSMLYSIYPSSHNNWNQFAEWGLSPKIDSLPEELSLRGYETISLSNHQNAQAPQVPQDPFQKKLNLSKEYLTEKYIKNFKNPFLLYLYTSQLHFPYVTCENQALSDDGIAAPDGLPTNLAEYEDALASYLSTHVEDVFRPEVIKKHQNIFNDRELNKKSILELYDTFVFSKEMPKYLVNAWDPIMDSFLQFIDGNNPDHVKYLKKTYSNCLKGVDKDLGLLFEILSKSPFSKNTIVVLRSDHGEEFFEHGYFNHANKLYQETIKTPLIIKTPKTRFVTYSGFSQDIDIYPTLLDLLGFNLPSHLQGVSLLPAISDNMAVRQYQISQKGPGIETFIKGTLKLIRIKEKTGVYIYELYDLSNDPEEKNNLIQQKKDVANELANEYEEILGNQTGYRPVSEEQELLSPEKRQQMIKEGYF